MKFYVFIAAFLIGSIAFSCKQKQTQYELDQENIAKYLSDSGLVAKETVDGISYVELVEGTGIKPDLSSVVTVVYRGRLLNGNVFDESDSLGASFKLTGVIKGWQKGIPLMKQGSKGILLIPSLYGYGTAGTTGIPGNSVLVFDVELLDVD